MSTEVLCHPITVNGVPREIAEGARVRDLLLALDMDPDQARGIAVALNDEVLPRREWASQALGAGDRIEIVTAKQGG